MRENASAGAPPPELPREESGEAVHAGLGVARRFDLYGSAPASQQSIKVRPAISE